MDPEGGRAWAPGQMVARERARGRLQAGDGGLGQALSLLADFPVNAEEQFGAGSRGVKYPREPNGLPYDVCLTGFQYQKIAPAIGFGAMCLDGKPIVADAKDKNGPFDITNAHDLELLDLVLRFGLAAGATKMLALSAIMREGVVFALRKGFGGRYEGETEVSAGGVRLPLHLFTDLSVEGRRDIALGVAGTPHLQLLINPGVSLVVSLGLCAVVSVTGRGMSLEGIMGVLSAGCGLSHEQLVEFLRLLKDRATPRALDALGKEMATDPGMDVREQIHFLFSHAGGVMLGELKDIVRSFVPKPVRRQLYDDAYETIAEKLTPGARGKEALKQLEGLGEDGAALAAKRIRESGAGPALFACLSDFEGGDRIGELARKVVEILGQEAVDSLVEPIRESTKDIVGTDDASVNLRKDTVQRVVRERLGAEKAAAIAGLEGGLLHPFGFGKAAALEAGEILGPGRLFDLRMHIKTVLEEDDVNEAEPRDRHEVVLDEASKLFGPDVANKLRGLEGGVLRHVVVDRQPSVAKKECPVCQKKVTNLPNHLKSHSDEKPFCCERCGTRFKRQGDMKKHVADVRCKPRNTLQKAPPKRLFACTSCDKTFTRHYNLVRHQMVHTGVKPYNCELCSSSFALKKDLQRHRAKHSMGINATREEPGETNENGEDSQTDECSLEGL
ncbi:hypothetical protein DFJ74DRAFT_674159 [Hyaloraphidium curvatum]|nr:hypothetical protein DFJ74DRAFT_674159 [Hyaloraphidium curvatum]